MGQPSHYDTSTYINTCIRVRFEHVCVFWACVCVKNRNKRVKKIMSISFYSYSSTYLIQNPVTIQQKWLVKNVFLFKIDSLIHCNDTPLHKWEFPGGSKILQSEQCVCVCVCVCACVTCSWNQKLFTLVAQERGLSSPEVICNLAVLTFTTPFNSPVFQSLPDIKWASQSW